MDKIPEFQLHCSRKGLSERTVKIHVGNLRRLFRYTPDFDKKAIDQFLLDLQLKGARHSYLNKYANTIREWANCFNLSEELKTYPFWKDQEYDKGILSDEEIEAFLALEPIRISYVHRNGKSTVNRYVNEKSYRKWTLFFTILAFTGLRPGELATMHLYQIDWGQGVFMVTPEKSKTRTARKVPIPPRCIEALKKHITTLKDDRVFPGDDRKYVSDVQWSYNFHTRIKRLKEEKGIVINRPHISVYSLRHSIITRLLSEDVALPKVMKLAGHRRIETTMHYTHMVTKDVIQAMQSDPMQRIALEPNYVLQELSEYIEKFGIQKDQRFNYRLVKTDTGIQLIVEMKLT